MVAGVFAGNISDEATTPTGNTFDEAMRGGWANFYQFTDYTAMVFQRLDRIVF
jgi:hypothetical protein